MGEIKLGVLHGHLNGECADEIEILFPFVHWFDVTWAASKVAYNTRLSVYLLKPSQSIAEMYGLTKEVALFYAHYRHLQPRTMQAIDKILLEEPLRSRAEKLNCFLVADSKDVQQWIDSYSDSIEDQARITIGFYSEDLRKRDKDNWFVRNILDKQFYCKDLYDFKLPLNKDTYFFGRRTIVTTILDSVRKQENRGLFGLRKTGKTSTLYKIKRMLEVDKIADVFIYDCKDTSIRKLRWFELLEKICWDIVDRYSQFKELKKEMKKYIFDERKASESFAQLISKLRSKTIVLVFDEIEWISFYSKFDKHWELDFIEFWQSFWSCQSKFRNIIAVIAGVNPGVVEVDTVLGVQNPLFGIVSHDFLRGFEYSEMQEMVKTLGNKMGLKFNNDALMYLYKRYGGHPYLTRVACSFINSKVRDRDEKRPFPIDIEYLVENEQERDNNIQHYCEHVVSELRLFYPNEYEMLELLSTKQIRDFVEISRNQTYINHLQSYGLINRDNTNRPQVSIGVVADYVGVTNARKDGRRTIYKIIDLNNRETWLTTSIKSVLADLRFLEKLIKKNSRLLIFGPNSFPEADQLLGLKVCKSRDDFQVFINTFNRCFVESIETYGKSISKGNYFWNEIKNEYPNLFDSLYRIKTYRHEEMHLELNAHASESLLRYLRQDLEGRRPGQVEDLYFILQQCVFDSFLAGIQIEIDKLI